MERKDTGSVSIMFYFSVSETFNEVKEKIIYFNKKILSSLDSLCAVVTGDSLGWRNENTPKEMVTEFSLFIHEHFSFIFTICKFMMKFTNGIWNSWRKNVWLIYLEGQKWRWIQSTHADEKGQPWILPWEVLWYNWNDKQMNSASWDLHFFNLQVIFYQRLSDL